MKLKLYRVLEIAVGCCAAIAVAMLLGLQNSVSAGIITILSLQDTTRETLRSAVQRLLAYALAVLLAYAAFGLLGYSLLGFGAYLLCFALLCILWNMQASLPICTVLISHFWIARHMGLAFIGNETLLMLIGTAIGIGLNLFLPRGTQAIRREQQHVEEILRRIFDAIAIRLEGRQGAEAVTADVAELKQALAEAERKAEVLRGNTLLADVRYYGQYVEMRRRQYTLLRRMEAALLELPEELPEQARTLARLMRSIAEALHERNDAVALLAGLERMREDFRADELPQTRQAFEARATLYYLLIETEHFLLTKKTFVEELTEEQRQTFLAQ